MGFTTSELKSNFLRSAGPDDALVCVAQLVHGGRTTQVWDATVRREAVLAGSVLKDPQFVTAGLKDQSAAVLRAAREAASTAAQADAIAAMLPGEASS